jgi:ferredoxin
MIEILVDHTKCDGCSGHALCKEKCPEDAVTVSRMPMHEVPVEPVSLITGEMAICEKCGNQFMPERKLATLLDQKKITPKAVQHICPDCRRGQLMDSYLNVLDQG